MVKLESDLLTHRLAGLADLRSWWSWPTISAGRILRTAFIVRLFFFPLVLIGVDLQKSEHTAWGRLGLVQHLLSA